MQVFTWTENQDELATYTVADGLMDPSKVQLSLQAISREIDRQIVGDDIEEDEFSEIYSYEATSDGYLGYGQYGRLECFLVVGSREEAVNLFNQYLESLQEEA